MRRMKSALNGLYFAALHHEDIQKDPQRISKLEPYSDLYNWKGLEFPVVVSR